jgi:3-hydroxyisobutyrate dehydrogenase
MTDMQPAAQPAPGQVGFIGLGAMGSRMIRHIRGATGFVLHDVDAARAQALAHELGGAPGARAARGLQDFTDADVVVLMLPDSSVVDQVLHGDTGLLSVLKAGACIIDMGSSTPSRTLSNAAAARARGIDFVDAPVSGGIGGAEAASLAVMVGASQQAFEQHTPLLQCMGAKVIRAGDVGSGHAVKALNNLLGATILAASAEVFAVGEKFGLHPAVMHSIIDASSGGSFMSNRVWPKAVLPHTWDFGFALALMNKDVGIAMSLIESTGIQTVLAQANAALWSEAQRTAAPGADMTEVVRRVRASAGLGDQPD